MVQAFEANALKVITSKKIQIIFEEFDSRIKGTTANRKYFGLSGHDTNMVPILIGLGLSSVRCLKRCFREKMKIRNDDGYTSKNINERVCSSDTCLGVPGYASNMVFELSKKLVSQKETKKSEYSYFLRVLVNGRALPICPVGNDKPGICPYGDMKKLFIDKFVLTDKEFDKECYGEQEIKI